MVEDGSNNFAASNIADANLTGLWSPPCCVQGRLGMDAAAVLNVHTAQHATFNDNDAHDGAGGFC
jgi:hypothetical protein